MIRLSETSGKIFLFTKSDYTWAKGGPIYH